MHKFKYLILICITGFCINCGSRSVSIQDFGDQITLTDSILLYFQQEQFDKIVSHLDNKVKTQLNKEQLAVIWAQLNTQVGKYQKSELYKAEKVNTIANKVVYKCYFGSQKLYLELFFGKDNNIVGIFFKPNV